MRARERAHVRTGAPRSAGRLAGRSSRRRYIRRRLLSSLCVRECRLMHVHLSPRIYIDLDGAWTSPDTRTRAARRAPRLGHNAREIRATPLFFLLLFHPEVLPARPCVGYLLLYSRYLDTFHDLLLSFVTSAVSSSCFLFFFFFSFLFPLLLHRQRFSPRILLRPFHARYRLDTFPIILYHVFMRFYHFCL